MKARFLKLALSAVCASLSGGASAGPPFLTDDPEPADTGHWEIYASLIDAAGRGTNFEGSTAVELNYGAAPDLQLTVGLPVDYSHSRAGWRWGRGDVELSAKYRIVNDEDAGIQVAVFPAMTLPTGSNGMGSGRVTEFLPVWVQKDAGRWSVFGGGGYALNPGAGNRNYWTGGLAVSRQFGERLLLGAEADRQGAASIDDRASTSVGFGGIYELKRPFRLLASGGPTFEDGGKRPGFHLFMALGIFL
jgi:hypothetical protein